jgi:hypothetical protein
MVKVVVVVVAARAEGAKNAQFCRTAMAAADLRRRRQRICDGGGFLSSSAAAIEDYDGGKFLS